VSANFSRVGEETDKCSEKWKDDGGKQAIDITVCGRAAIMML
jgi:hypothetical protein